MKDFLSEQSYKSITLQPQNDTQSKSAATYSTEVTKTHFFTKTGIKKLKSGDVKAKAEVAEKRND